MKKFILLVLVSIFFISCGQSIPPNGKVTNKIFIEGNYYYITTLVQSGKSTIPVMTRHYRPDIWEITIEDLTTKESFTFRTTKQKFELLNRNDTIKVSDYELY